MIFAFNHSQAITFQDQLIKVKNDTLPVLGIAKNEFATLYDNFDSSRSYIKSLDQKEFVYIYDSKTNKYNEEYYAVFTNKLDSGYVKVDDIFMSNEEGYNKFTKENAQKRKRTAYSLALGFAISVLEKEIEEYDNYNKIGLVVTRKEYAYADYGSEFGLDFSFYNGYNKDIKYIDLTVRSYNRVGDPISDDLGRNVRRIEIIGPIKSESEGSARFDDLFWDGRDVISRLVITYMKVTFMDGSVREIKDVSKHMGKKVYNKKK